MSEQRWTVSREANCEAVLLIKELGCLGFASFASFEVHENEMRHSIEYRRRMMYSTMSSVPFLLKVTLLNAGLSLSTQCSKGRSARASTKPREIADELGSSCVMQEVPAYLRTQSEDANWQKLSVEHCLLKIPPSSCCSTERGPPNAAERPAPEPGARCPGPCG